MYNLLKQFFTLGSSKIEVFETHFFDIVTTQYDHPRYINHVLGRIYVFSTLFKDWVGGGLPRDWDTTCLCSLSPWARQKMNHLAEVVRSSHASVYRGRRHIRPFWAFLSLFAYPTPRG